VHFNAFLDIYTHTYDHDYGFLRPIIPEVVGPFTPEGSRFPACESISRLEAVPAPWDDGGLTLAPNLAPFSNGNS